MEQSRNIDNAEMMMVRTGQLDLQDVLGESLLQVLDIGRIRAWQAHAFSSLEGYQRLATSTHVEYTSSRMRANSLGLKSSSFNSQLNFNRRSFSFSFVSALVPGIIETLTTDSWFEVRRRTIWVANRVQISLATGKERPVSPSRSEDFPLD